MSVAAGSDPGRRRPWRQPLAGESFDGYLAYRASQALLPGPFAITQLGGAVRPHYPELAFAGDDAEVDLEAVAAALEVDVSELRGRAHPEVEPGRRRFGTTAIDVRLIERRARRFSPASLRGSPHHRLLWSARCLTFCEESWETLADACPAAYCGAVQRWRHSSGVDRCDRCGGPLDGARTLSVPDRLRPSLRRLSGLLHPDPRRAADSLAAFPSAIAALTAGGVVEAACAVAGLHDPGVETSARSFLRGDAEPLRTAEAMAAAVDMLGDWPSAGERLAGERLSTRAGRGGDGNRGATLRFLAFADAPERRRSVAAVAGTLRDALRGNLHLGTPIKQAVVGTGLRVVGMASSRRRGEVETLFHLSGERVVPLISNASLERLRAPRRGPQAREAAADLGVPSYGVELMLLDGALEPVDCGAGPPYGQTTRILASSLARLLGLVAEAADAASDASWISMNAAARRVGGDLKPWASWFAAVAERRLPARLETGTAPLSTRLMVAPGAVEELRGIAAAASVREGDLAPLMSQADAAATLNLHMRNAATVLASWPAPVGKAPVVPLAEVRALASEWMSIGELASRLGVGPAAARSRSTGLRIGPCGVDRSQANRTLLV